MIHRSNPYRNQILGGRFKAFGIFIILIGPLFLAFGFWEVFDLPPSIAKVIGFLVLAFLPFLIMGGFYLWRVGVFLKCKNGDEVLARNRRPTILYLRSFKSDNSFNDYAKEEDMEEVLKNLGPFIAIGKPGEPIQPRGAARLYLNVIQNNLRGNFNYFNLLSF